MVSSSVSRLDTQREDTKFHHIVHWWSALAMMGSCSCVYQCLYCIKSLWVPMCSWLETICTGNVQQVHTYMTGGGESVVRSQLLLWWHPSLYHISRQHDITTIRYQYLPSITSASLRGAVRLSTPLRPTRRRPPHFCPFLISLPYICHYVLFNCRISTRGNPVSIDPGSIMSSQVFHCHFTPFQAMNSKCSAQ